MIPFAADLASHPRRDDLRQGDIQAFLRLSSKQERLGEALPEAPPFKIRTPVGFRVWSLPEQSSASGCPRSPIPSEDMREVLDTPPSSFATATVMERRQ